MGPATGASAGLATLASRAAGALMQRRALLPRVCCVCFRVRTAATIAPVPRVICCAFGIAIVVSFSRVKAVTFSVVLPLLCFSCHCCCCRCFSQACTTSKSHGDRRQDDVCTWFSTAPLGVCLATSPPPPRNVAPPALSLVLLHSSTTARVRSSSAGFPHDGVAPSVKQGRLAPLTCTIPRPTLGRSAGHGFDVWLAIHACSHAASLHPCIIPARSSEPTAPPRIRLAPTSASTRVLPRRS